MSTLLQHSKMRYAVIQLSSTEGPFERLVLSYRNEETLRGLIAGPSIAGVGFSSRDEAVSAAAAGADLTGTTAPPQADGSAGFNAEGAQVHARRERLAKRMTFLPLSRLATTVVQLGIAVAIFIFYSKNIVSSTLRAVLAGYV